MSKKRDFENPKVQNCDFSTKSVPISAVFQIVRFPGNQKTALTGEIPVFLQIIFMQKIVLGVGT